MKRLWRIHKGRPVTAHSWGLLRLPVVSSCVRGLPAGCQCRVSATECRPHSNNSILSLWDNVKVRLPYAACLGNDAGEEEESVLKSRNQHAPNCHRGRNPCHCTLLASARTVCLGSGTCRGRGSHPQQPPLARLGSGACAARSTAWPQGAAAQHFLGGGEEVWGGKQGSASQRQTLGCHASQP